MEDGKGFERWLARRAAAPKTSQDEDYARFLSAMSGPGPDRNGRAEHLEPGGEDSAAGLSDDAIYRGYVSELDGSAARRRSEENAKRELRERQEEVIRHVRQVGGGMSRSFEDLRSRIPGAGKPYEGG